MVGCPEAAFPSVEAVLQPMARVVIRAGEAGAGQAAKICNNMLLGISMIGVCEAFALAERLDLDARLLGEARGFHGRFLIDEDVLRVAGETDFGRYAVDPSQPLSPDLFL